MGPREGGRGAGPTGSPRARPGGTGVHRRGRRKGHRTALASSTFWNHLGSDDPSERLTGLPGSPSGVRGIAAGTGAGQTGEGPWVATSPRYDDTQHRGSSPGLWPQSVMGRQPHAGRRADPQPPAPRGSPAGTCRPRVPRGQVAWGPQPLASVTLLHCLGPKSQAGEDPLRRGLQGREVTSQEQGKGQGSSGVKSRPRCTPSPVRPCLFHLLRGPYTFPSAGAPGLVSFHPLREAMDPDPLSCMRPRGAPAMHPDPLWTPTRCPACVPGGGPSQHGWLRGLS